VKRLEGVGEVRRVESGWQVEGERLNVESGWLDGNWRLGIKKGRGGSAIGRGNNRVAECSEKRRLRAAFDGGGAWGRVTRTGRWRCGCLTCMQASMQASNRSKAGKTLARDLPSPAWPTEQTGTPGR